MHKLKNSLKDIIKETYLKDKFIKNPTCYFYDLSAIEKNIKELKDNCPSQISLYYAMKANNNVEVMKYVCQLDYVKGLEIASSGELEQAIKYDKSIIFTGPGKTDYELEQAIKSKIRFINVESIAETIRINNIAEKLNIDNVDILLRINLNYSITDAYEHMSGQSTKMGIDEDDCIESFNYISNLKRVTVKGIHVFAASGVLSYESLLKSNNYIFKLVKEIENFGYNISVIDFGGGIGIDYSNENRNFDVKKYSEGLTNLISSYKFENKEIIMELGTYIVGNAGYYTSKIIDIKKIKGKKHIIIAGGVNHMGLPLEMRRKHPVCIIPMNEEKLYDKQPLVHKENADISGPLCMVSDKLCWDEYIKHAEIGDVVVFFQSGAYCYGEGMHEFLSHPLPDEIIVE